MNTYYENLKAAKSEAAKSAIARQPIVAIAKKLMAEEGLSLVEAKAKAKLIANNPGDQLAGSASL